MSEDFKTKAAEKKVPLAMVPLKALMGAARVFGYGAKKYAKGNFLKATMEDGAGERYPSGALRHLAEIQNLDGTFDTKSLAEPDDESGLPHIDHWICGLIMLRAIMIKEGVLPADPGVGKDPPETFLVEKLDAGAERARVSALHEFGDPMPTAVKSALLDRAIETLAKYPPQPEPRPIECNGAVATCACAECVEYRTSTTTPLPDGPGSPAMSTLGGRQGGCYDTRCTKCYGG